MNYDDPIFKVPALPTKRKAQEDPSTSYKSSKQPRLDDPDPDGLAMQPTLEDLEQEENEPDEEGGRFHGSGVSTSQREILSYFDREDGVPNDGEVIGREGFSERDVKKLAAALEKAVSVNESRRSKFADDPQKYGVLFYSMG
jgi:beta-catenin-like protein 1